ncbi:MAG: hypothetical protein KGQ36_02250 [Rickettsiales bacterium]|nr:hypothetical protein [Rickettsiales bacterium]
MHATTMNKEYFNNPIKILHRLKEAGFTQEQAEAQVEIFTDYINHNLATKQDLKEIRFELREMEMRITIKTATIVGSIVGFFYLLEIFF